MKFLISGASGNIGYEVIRGLHQIGINKGVVAGDYDLNVAKSRLEGFDGLEFVRLDFAQPNTFEPALRDIDLVFLLRPPQLADVPKYFEPFINSMLANSVKKIVFLSVQGVEKQKRIPHHKIEQLIVEKGLDYVFLRPSYFMQNLTTTLFHEIRGNSRIFVPSGHLKLAWVDGRDIGLVGANVLREFEKYRNNAYELTGSEVLGFKEVAQQMTDQLGVPIRYVSPNLIRFIITMRKNGQPMNMIFVMIMLHYLPRFGKNIPRTTKWIESIIGQNPGTLEDFIKREEKSSFSF